MTTSAIGLVSRHGRSEVVVPNISRTLQKGIEIKRKNGAVMHRPATVVAPLIYVEDQNLRERCRLSKQGHSKVTATEV